MDPWMIMPEERAMHANQFGSLNPAAGFIDGNGARGFFMQSGLPPMVLAQIWGLADLNGDGQMDLNEFSIACKLIKMKLTGYEIPPQLPPSMLALPSMGGVAMMPQQQPGMMAMQQQQVPGMMMSQPMMQPMGGMMQPMGMQPVAAAQQMMAPQPGMMQPPPPPVSAPIVSMAAPTMLSSGASTPVHVDWAVPPATRAKYTAQFQNTDRARTGFLAGVQARNILVQSQLPQQTLAQVWGLSDVDNDGRLSVEEFILSGYLCELALKGEALPTALPPNLVPPSMRKGSVSVALSDTVSTPGSVHNDLSSASTFEDKRRENFSKGQAELDRRRQSLVDQQKREEEEKKKKEAEEAAEREKQKQEMERKRLEEWEKQRKAELTEHRQREQDKLFALKARQENLNQELENLREKVKTLTDGIGDSRNGVSDVKTFIDGMRSSRDEKMKDMSGLKERLKEQNERLIKVTQEKAQMEAKNKAMAEKIGEGAENEQLTEFEIRKNEKEKEVIQLREEFKAVKEKEEGVSGKLEEVKSAMQNHREDLERVIEACRALYDSFDDKRREIKAEKQKIMRELTDPDHAWGNEDEGAAAVPEAEAEVAVEPTPAPAPAAAASNGDGDGGDHVKYVALYPYQSEKDDELTFREGDVIMVNPNQACDPGWLAGELNGKVGWFPEGYVQRSDQLESGAPVATSAEPAGTAEQARALYDWPEMQIVRGELLDILQKTNEDWWLAKKAGTDNAPGYIPAVYVSVEALEARGSTPTDAPDAPTSEVPDEVYVAVFDYQSEEAGDLCFAAGEQVKVIKKESEWWTGQIGARSGVFPYNYVELATAAGAAPASAVAAVAEPAAAPVEQEAPQSVANNEAKVTFEEPVAPAGAAIAEQPAAAPASGGSNTLKKKKKKKDESGKKMELAKVVAPYEATSKEQLTLTKGQMIVVKKRTETGWWQGEVQGGEKGKKRQTGWFPASYVKLLESKETKSSNAAGAAVGSATAAEKLRAVHAFQPENQNGDELSFEAGEVITLLSKDEPDWWKGQIGEDRIGVFPANYVEPVGGE